MRGRGLPGGEAGEGQPEDLYYRLKVLRLDVPPLRARREDILPLAEHFLARESRTARRFTPAAEERLLGYAWPGNVRELESAVKHGAALAAGSEVAVDDLPCELGGEAPAAAGPSAPRGATAPKTLAEVEREHVLGVLEACGGSPSAAARALGVARNTLWRKLRAYG